MDNEDEDDGEIVDRFAHLHVDPKIIIQGWMDAVDDLDDEGEEEFEFENFEWKQARSMVLLILKGII